MGLSGKKVVQVNIKCNKDVVHGLFRYKLSEMVNIVPEYFLSCDLQEGKWGAVGSIININYHLVKDSILPYGIHGKKQFCKLTIEAVDKTNTSTTFKVLDGDITRVYTSFKVELRVDGNSSNCTATWNFEFEKMNESVPDPDSFFEAAQNIIKYAETRLEAALNVTKDLKIP